MTKISNTEYQELRNKIWEDLVASGVTSDEDENYTAFDNVLGNHLKVDWDNQDENDVAKVIQKLKKIQENMKINQDADWIENDPLDEFNLISEDIGEAIKDLENSK